VSPTEGRKGGGKKEGSLKKEELQLEGSSIGGRKGVKAEEEKRSTGFGRKKRNFLRWEKERRRPTANDGGIEGKWTDQKAFTIPRGRENASWIPIQRKKKSSDASKERGEGEKRRKG